jgi:ferric-dicitrate binding protein FerR (iron transport regulator)
MSLIIVRVKAACFSQLMKIDVESRSDMSAIDPEVLFMRAADAAQAARQACRDWEHGSDPQATMETAGEALAHAGEAIAAVRLEDGPYAEEGAPETRRHRLAEAAWLLLLAGTDEHGESCDLALSAALFRRAAAW